MRRTWVLLLPLLLASGPAYAPELKAGFEAAEQGLWREARFRYERAAAAATAAPDFRIFNNLAVSAEAQGDFTAARGYYEQAIALAPDNRELRENFTAFRAYSRKIPGLWPPEPKKPAASAPADASAPAAPIASAPGSAPASAPSPAGAGVIPTPNATNPASASAPDGQTKHSPPSSAPRGGGSQ